MLSTQAVVNPLQQTVTDALVERIRGEIIRGDFQPGDRLRLRDLAAHYQISTMPVRGALRRLEMEGLLTGEPRKGMMVAHYSADELIDIYDIRATLEAMATRLAVPHITPQMIERLQTLADEMEAIEVNETANDGLEDVVKVVDLNGQFHETLYAACGRKHLCEMVILLRHRTAHYLHAFRRDLGRTAHDDHRAIVKACRKRDAERAATIIQAHIARAGRALVAHIQPDATPTSAPTSRASRAVNHNWRNGTSVPQGRV